MSETVIKVEHLSKHYKLGVINNGTLYKDIQTWFALKFGKDDPNGKIDKNRFSTTKEDFWALKDLNFEIQKGDCVGIIGKNGAGKSTLLKLLSRITAPTEGKIKLRGRVASLLEVGTGFHGELTGRENIYLNGAILGMKRHEVTRKMDEIIAFSEIEEHIDTPVKRYSSGMYVRLAFAVAAHLDSEILIADEVLAVGDAEFQKKAIGKMNALSTDQGRTVLFVSHNMDAVRRLCKKGIVLEKGRIVRQDDDIQKSINWYLGLNRKSQTVRTLGWQNDGSFKNKYFCPQSITFLDEGEKEITGAIPYEKGFKIRLEFEIQNQPLANMDFWLNVYFNFKRILNLPAQAGRSIYLPGKYICDFNIKPCTFLPEKYMISLGASITNAEYIINPESKDITTFFEIVTDKSNVIGNVSKKE